MAINNGGSINNDQQESSPLLTKQGGVGEDEEKKLSVNKSKEATADVESSPEVGTGARFGWTTDGMPLVCRSVVGEPMGRSQWDSSLLACLGRNDEFCSSDIEVCLLGSVAPCVLYGSNAERLGSAPGTVHVRNLTGHVDAVEAVWKARCSGNSEGRELRRRLPHPGHNAQPVLVMIPPGEQTMSRGA
ncbi:Detected protein of confused Function [Hibiscus syriacus]|uniref:Detected protein of confused Function n=1 Tax=Hibiscus syriacus TaxID=106335 RepID=A0A6A2WZ73_HIBSY|nr:Detected protein of confused Function [Hibiscus syriacus]